ncbi:MAG: ABC transporter permease [Planctomycetes bacterium]|nr:ABC transporter permease [Planctomycetota bacterium]
MISILARASLRYLRRHPAQLVLAVVGVALGVAVVVGIETAAASTARAFRLSTRALSGSATHVVRGDARGVPDALYVELALDPLAPKSAPVVQRSLALIAPAPRTLDLLGVDPFAERPFRASSVSSGAFDGAALVRSAGAWLAGPTARELGLEVGDELAFSIGSETRRLVLAGVIEPQGESARAALADVVLTDIATAQELLGVEGRLSRIDLALADDAPTRAAQLERVRAKLPPTCVLEPASSRAEAVESMTRAFELNLRALGFLALLVGVFLVYNTMTFAVVQRRSLWGTLRAVGATRGEVFRTVCSEALAIGCAGTACGIGLGWLLAHALLGLVTQTINDLYYVVSVRELVLTPMVLAEALALGLGATLIGALFPALDAMRTTPRATLDRAAPESRLRSNTGRLALAGAGLCALALALLRASGTSLALGFAALFLLLLSSALAVPLSTTLGCRALAPLFGLVGGNLGRIAARGVTSHLARSSVAIAALSIALSATAGMGILVDSFRGTVVRWLGTALAADVYVSSPSSFSNRDSAVLAPELVQRMLSAEGVSEASLFRDIELDLADGSRVFASAVDLRPRSRSAYTLLEGDSARVWSRFDGQPTLLVSEALARKRGLGVGDELQVRTAQGPRAFEVLGVFRDYSSDQGWALVSRSTWVAASGEDRVSALGLFLEEQRDVDATVAALRARLASGETARVRSKRELENASLEVFDRTFAVTRVLRLLAGVVALLGVIGALLAIELERERELGVLRALGLSPAGLRAVVLGQSGAIGLLAGAFALPLGVATALVLILVINARSFGWTLEVEIAPRVLAETFALALVSAFVAGLYPALRMARLSPAAALRGE